MRTTSRFSIQQPVNPPRPAHQGKNFRLALHWLVLVISLIATPLAWKELHQKQTRVSKAASVTGKKLDNSYAPVLRHGTRLSPASRLSYPAQWQKHVLYLVPVIVPPGAKSKEYAKVALSVDKEVKFDKEVKYITRLRGRSSLLGGIGIAVGLLLLAIARHLKRAANPAWSSMKAIASQEAGTEADSAGMINATRAEDTEAERRGHRKRLEQLQTYARFGSYEVYVAHTGNHQTLQCSTEFAQILGWDTAANPLSLAEYAGKCIHSEDQARIRALIEKTLIEKGKAESEYRIICPDGKSKYVYDVIEYIYSGTESNVFFGRLHDITECKLAELERLSAAVKFQSFVEQLGGMPYIASLNSNASLLYISPKLEKLLGFSPDQWRNDPELRIKQLHPGDREHVLQAIREPLSARQGFSIDYRIATSTGELRWLHDEARIMVSAEGTPLFLQGVIIDITERKSAQEELERSHRDLQRMITVLDSLREEEQKRLAQEMHDDLGQLLAAMKMDLSALQQRLPRDDAEILQQLGNINELVDAMVVSVRRIIADLPPKVMEDLGLFCALELLTSNFQKRYQIPTALTLPKVPQVITGEIATHVYRMVQESLNNVAKHARATQVNICLSCHDNQLRLSVIDNGAGIPLHSPRKPESFGLIGIRERVTALGGELKIDSDEGSGTRLQIIIPLDAVPMTTRSETWQERPEQ